MKSHKFFRITERARQVAVVPEVVLPIVAPIEEIPLPANNINTPAPEVKPESLSSASKIIKKKI